MRGRGEVGKMGRGMIEERKKRRDIGRIGEGRRGRRREEYSIRYSIIIYNI